MQTLIEYFNDRVAYAGVAVEANIYRTSIIKKGEDMGIYHEHHGYESPVALTDCRVGILNGSYKVWAKDDWFPQVSYAAIPLKKMDNERVIRFVEKGGAYREATFNKYGGGFSFRQHLAEEDGIIIMKTHSEKASAFIPVATFEMIYGYLPDCVPGDKRKPDEGYRLDDSDADMRVFPFIVLDEDVTLINPICDEPRKYLASTVVYKQSLRPGTWDDGLPTEYCAIEENPKYFIDSYRVMKSYDSTIIPKIGLNRSPQRQPISRSSQLMCF